MSDQTTNDSDNTKHAPGEGSHPSSGSPFTTAEDFLKYLHAINNNRVDADNGFEELFGEKSPFRIVCTKCGSMSVSVIGEAGRMGSSQTGYMEGTNIIKCDGCGAAVECDS